MDYKFIGLKITDDNIEEKILNKIEFKEFTPDIEYEIVVEFYNRDLIDFSLDENVSYEIKKEHYQFIKKIRNIFENYNIKINKFYLMGTIVDILDDEINISIRKAQFNENKRNIVWPSKEIFIYEDGKNKLDSLLYSNQISIEEYEENLEDLKYELSIFDREDLEYLN